MLICTVTGSLTSLLLSALHMRPYSLLIISRSLTLHKGDGAGGAGGQAVTQPIAVIVPHELCLAVRHGDSSLMAGLGAGAAAVAFFLINLDDPSNHFDTPLRFLLTL